MANISRTFTSLLVGCLCLSILQGQSTIPAAGGNAKGSGGTVTYTVGQITYKTISETTGSVAQGIQQSYEISIVTAIENTEGITLEYKVYPNPTSGQIILTIKPFDKEDFRCRLYDLNGILLMDKLIEGDVTEISMENLAPAPYILIIINVNIEIKSFRIIKN